VTQSLTNLLLAISYLYSFVCKYAQTYREWGYVNWPFRDKRHVS